MSMELSTGKLTATDVSTTYPKGAYFITNVDKDPKILLGYGTWELVIETETKDFF